MNMTTISSKQPSFPPRVPRPGVQNTYGGRQTQPTQLINRSSSQITAVSSPHKSVVQVAASSPTPAPVRRPGGILASAMAPAGTVFRVPHGVTKAPRRPPVIDISDDDGPSYRGGSSDSDTAELRKHDIKTSSFGRRGQDSTDMVRSLLRQSRVLANSKLSRRTRSTNPRPKEQIYPGQSSIPGIAPVIPLF